MRRILGFFPDETYENWNGILPPLYSTPSSVWQEHILLQNLNTTIWNLIKLTAHPGKNLRCDACFTTIKIDQVLTIPVNLQVLFMWMIEDNDT
jgi:hypothetical protein